MGGVFFYASAIVRCMDRPHEHNIGLVEDTVRQISSSKGEPEWMLELRLRAFALWQETEMPKWGPDLSGLDLANISYYSEPLHGASEDWGEVPDEIRDTFVALGIPKAEREYLGGVGAQFDSGAVYHRLKASLEAKGVIFEDMDVAVKKYPDIVRKHFMTSCVRIEEHKFSMLHAACWSGGTFIYVPNGVAVELPLQAYFRMNKMRSAQFEHTLIIVEEAARLTYIEGCSAPQYVAASLHAGCVEIFVGKSAEMRYISIENWSKNTYNLNTKKSIVAEDGNMMWVSGNMGAKVSMLYPSSILLGDRSHSESLSIVVGGDGQVQDVGAKAILLGADTSASIISISIASGGSVVGYRGLVDVHGSARHALAHVVCDTLLLDGESRSYAFPVTRVCGSTSSVSHEARVGRVNDDALFYLKHLGFSEREAMRVLIGGFLHPIIKELPLEYAVEFNRLIDIEFLEGESRRSPHKALS